MDSNSQSGDSVIYSELSGNEIYCLGLYGFTPGDMLVGNSVFSLGFIGSIGTSIKTTFGGELKQMTNMISEGRRLSLNRFEAELDKSNGVGAASVTSELIFHAGNIEFLSIGSTVHRSDNQMSQRFSTSSDGQELYCQLDAGYAPLKFVFGNIAYSIGIGRGLLGEFRQLLKGEVKEYSEIFNITRNEALKRITDEAKQFKANSVIGIRTTIIPLVSTNVQEMMMIGTASYNAQLEPLIQLLGGDIITSDLTAEETWNLAKTGYAPLKLVLGTSVYSLGVVGGIKAMLKNLVKGEISDLTEMIYGAREQSIKKLQQQAKEVDADLIVGIKTYIYDLGNGLVEFLAIGSAVKKVDYLKTTSDQLPVQAVIKDKETYINKADKLYSTTAQDQLIKAKQST